VSKTLLALAVIPVLLQAQPARIRQRIDETQRVRLAGHVHPLAQPRYDRGAAPAGLAMDHMLLLLKRSPQQQQELASLLEDLNDSTSTRFHKWLTPDEFGSRFGLSEQDLQTVTSWLTANGFHVDNVPQGRNFIEFSGTAGAVRRAFGTDMRRYDVRGESHWANAISTRLPRRRPSRAPWRSPS
jgi:trimeric autotransporter adhesin